MHKYNTDTFIQQGCIKLIKSDNEYIYIIKKKILIQINTVLLNDSILYVILKKMIRWRNLSSNQHIRIIFFKDRVTLRTGVMMLKILLCVTRMNYILKYIKIEKSISSI